MNAYEHENLCKKIGTYNSLYQELSELEKLRQRIKDGYNVCTINVDGFLFDYTSKTSKEFTKITLDYVTKRIRELRQQLEDL